MNRIIALHIARFIFLVILQVFVLNNVEFNGYINPYIYVMFLLLLPFQTPKWFLLILGFLLGFSIDIFMKTPGMNIAACVLMAWARPGIIHLLSRGMDMEPHMKPGIKHFGFRWFFMYALILVFLHHLLLFYLEAFKFADFFKTFYKVIISTAFSVSIIMLIHYFSCKRKR